MSGSFLKSALFRIGKFGGLVPRVELFSFRSDSNLPQMVIDPKAISASRLAGPVELN